MILVSNLWYITLLKRKKND